MIFDKVECAYHLVLPPKYNKMHNVFHVSLLKSYVKDSKYVLIEESIEIREDLTYVEHLVKIIDTQVKQLKNKEFPLGNVQWKCYRLERWRGI